MGNVLIRVAGAAVFAAIASGATAQTLNVTIIDRQTSDKAYSYVLPGTVTGSALASTNCSAFGSSVNCFGSSTGTTTVVPPRAGGYSVTGATLALRIPDGRVIVVNCDSKYALKGDFVNRRSCRIPPGDSVEAEFRGADAVLRWSISLDGRRRQQETYKILGTFEGRSTARPEAVIPASAPLQAAVSANPSNQGTATATVDAQVFAAPGDSQPVRTARAGTVFGLLGVDGAWCKVQYTDPVRGASEGFVRLQDVTLRIGAAASSDARVPVDLSFAGAPPAPAIERLQPNSAPVSPPPVPVFNGTAKFDYSIVKVDRTGTGALTTIELINLEAAALENVAVELRFVGQERSGGQPLIAGGRATLEGALPPNAPTLLRVPHAYARGLSERTARVELAHAHGKAVRDPRRAFAGAARILLVYKGVVANGEGATTVLEARNLEALPVEGFSVEVIYSNPKGNQSLASGRVDLTVPLMPGEAVPIRIDHERHDLMANNPRFITTHKGGPVELFPHR